MGCLTSSPSETKEHTQQQTESSLSPVAEIPINTLQRNPSGTYDPGNMSVSRTSTMINYHFPKRKDKIIKHPLPPIKSVIYTQFDLKAIQKKLTSRKRVIFVSIAQLNACIHNIPLFILMESIFCFKADRKWFFPSNKDEIARAKSTIAYQIKLDDKFKSLLIKKECQGLILWVNDNKSWMDISDALSKIQDPYAPLNSTASVSSTTSTNTIESQLETKSNDDDDDVIEYKLQYYKALQLDTSWWADTFDDNDALFCESGTQSIIDEITNCQLIFQPTMEVLYQSNTTLIPMRDFYISMYLSAHYDDMKNSNFIHNNDDNNDDHRHILAIAPLELNVNNQSNITPLAMDKKYVRHLEMIDSNSNSTKQ